MRCNDGGLTITSIIYISRGICSLGKQIMKSTSTEVVMFILQVNKILIMALYRSKYSCTEVCILQVKKSVYSSGGNGHA